MSRTLPFRPNPEHLHNEARALHKSCQRGMPDATRLLRAHLPRLAGQRQDGDWYTTVALQEAQFALACEYGFESWPKLIAFVDKAAQRVYFSDQSKKLLQFAYAEAVRLNHESVDPEHLLIAMLREELAPVTGDWLAEIGVLPDQLREAIERQRPMDGSKPHEAIVFSSTTKAVLGRAADEARAAGGPTGHLEHILLGILQDSDGVAAQALAATGVDADTVRQRLSARPAGQLETATDPDEAVQPRDGTT